MNFIVSITSLLMTTINPTLNVTEIADTSQLPLLNPELRKRETLKLRLDNGLEALIISDPGADQSAASVSVGAGSWSDPLEYPGMAHFCEHMLFMGTKKYPSENEFFTFVADYAGQANAYTAPNQTVYMFSSQTVGFLAILDRFAHFFIDPLFNPTFIAREMHAVDQEFAKNIEHDGWREYMVFKETGNQNHPNRMFSTGNSETLGKIPQSALKNWHEENYGAEKMHLAIYSPLPMDELKEIVVQTFSAVPNATKDPVDISGFLSSDQQVGHITLIKPIKDQRSVTLSWELPENLSVDPTKSADILAYALRRGGAHNLYEALKREELIDTMSIRVDEMGGITHRFFQISLKLTKKGLEEVDTAVLRCFQAIKGIQKTGVPAYLRFEKNKMAEINYQYQSRINPFEFISELGGSMTDEDLSSYPRNILLSSQYDPQKLREAAAALTPQTCSISILADPLLTKVPPNMKEKWLGAEYAIRPIPKKWLARWNAAQINPEIALALPNPFIPDNLALAPSGNSTPDLIASSSLGSAYYVRSPEFGVPESVYHIHIKSALITPNARSAVLSALYIDHITDILYPTLAQASSAGLKCAFDLDRSAIHLNVSGFSEKAPLLLQEVLKEMPLHTPSPEQFAIYVDRHEKAYLNGEKELAARQAKELLNSLLTLDQATKKEKLAALKTITYEDFVTFHEKLFDQTYTEALFAGNLSLKEAESVWLDIIHAIGKAPFPKEKQSAAKILQLSNEKGPYQIVQDTNVQGNATLLLIDEGVFTHQKRAAQEILSAAIKEAFFNELRTKQKTGYIAQSSGTEVETRLFQYFIVQSNSHQPEELLFRFEQFIEAFNDSVEEKISLERFDTLKASLISSLKTRFRNLDSKALLWDNLAFERDGDFAFVQDRIRALENISYSEMVESAHTFLGRENRRRLAILFEGKLAAPFAYQPIHIPQIGEVATYAPRMKKPLEEGVPCF